MNRLLNKIFFVTTGIFLGAVYLLIWMKLLNLPGVVIGLISSLALAIFLHRNFSKNKSLSKTQNIGRDLNLGLLIFSIFMSIASVIIYIVFYSTVQGLIS